eukprot:SAG31_NODE_1547_length_7925_cov_3.563251_5_plen_82_part_00
MAEPKQIRDKFQEAVLDNVPVMQDIKLNTLVTVIDSSNFLQLWETKRSLDECPGLGEDTYDEVRPPISVYMPNPLVASPRN